MRRDASALLFALLASVVAGGCALVGYDLDGYHQKGAGGSGGDAGGPGTSSTGGSPPNACTRGDRVCADAPPSGWSGPVELRVDAGAAEACEDDYPDMAYEGTTAPRGAPATCAPCACDTTPCAATTRVTSYKDAGCSMADLSTSGNPAICNPITPPGGNLWIKVNGPNRLPGVACIPSGGDPTIPPVEPGKRVIACGGATSRSGCPDGASCLPKPPPPFAAGVCVFRAGDMTCPAGLEKQVFFQSVHETRGCTACDCGKPALTCGVTARVYSDNACGNLVGNASVGDGCTEVSARWTGLEIALDSPCVAKGGAPVGELDGGKPTTFCCR